MEQDKCTQCGQAIEDCECALYVEEPNEQELDSFNRNLLDPDDDLYDDLDTEFNY